MEGVIPDPLLRPLPPSSLGPEVAEALGRALPRLAGEPVPLSAIARGEVGGVLTSAGELAGAGGSGADVRETVVGIGDRRDVVLGAPCPLGRLGRRRAVGVPDLRSEMLLRAHHPELVPVDHTADGPSSAGAIRIAPLWHDPGLETRGEVLESASWLPGPGQGIAVLLTSPREAATAGTVPVDSGATAILAVERGVATAFPSVVVLVRGWAFGDWLGLDALLLGRDGRRAVRGSVRCRRETPDRVAGRMIERLRERGAEHLIEGGVSPRPPSSQVPT